MLQRHFVIYYASAMNDALAKFASVFTPPGLDAGGAVAIPSLTGAADAFLAFTLAHRYQSVVLAVTPGLPDADRLADDLRLITAKGPLRILEFPPLLDGDKSALGLRLKTIAALRAYDLSPYPAVVVAPFPALPSLPLE